MNFEIITFYWSNNPGALIQSISLREFLKTEFKKKVKFNRFMPHDLIAAERKSQINRSNLKLLINILNQKRNLFNWKKKVANFKNPITKKIFSSKNLYVYGSDEIWNFSSKIFDFNSHFYGHANPNIKIAYACSIGNAEIKKISKNNYQLIKKNFKDFKSISVRDERSFNFVKKLTNIKPKIVVDPCFLSSPKIFNGKKSKYEKKFSQKKYILIYGNYFNQSEINDLIYFSKKKEATIISVFFVNKWADYNILNINPNDLIYFIKNSKYIITSMFHGVMLSYKYKKQFWYTIDPYRKNKLNYFLKKLNLKKQHIKFIGKSKINYRLKSKVLSKWINLSKNFLKKNLKFKKTFS